MCLLKNNNIIWTLVVFLNSTNFGFQGQVIAQWLSHDGADRNIKLVEPFSFRDNSGKLWAVPAGAVVNGASIPKALWCTVGPPFVGDYRYASVIHDYYCKVKSESWKDTHKMFYHASIAAGVPIIKAKVMYGGVYAGGPRWEKLSTTGLEGREEIIIDQESPGISGELIEELNNQIQMRDMSLEEIEAFVTQGNGNSD